MANPIAKLQADTRNFSKRYQAIHRFRSGIDLSHFTSAYHRIFPRKTSLQDYHGSAFPRRADLIFASRTPKRKTTAFREILWAIARCSHFSNELGNFISIYENYQVAIFENDNQRAINHLQEIEKNFGKSILLYQNLIACAYTFSSGSEPLDYASKVLDEVKSNNVLFILLHYARKRIEGATLRDKLRAEITEHVGDSGYEPYFLAKLLDPIDSSDEALSNLLFLDGQSSIIDYYTSLVQTLQNTVSSQILEEGAAALIRHPLKKLYKDVRDKRLVGILIALGDDIDDTLNIGISERTLAIEEYTDSQYDKCLIEAKKALLTDPLDISLRLLSCKAAVATGEIPEKPLGLVGELHESLFNLLSVNDQFFRSAYALLQLSDRFFDHGWAQYLKVAVWHELGPEEPKRAQSWMRDMFIRDCHITPFMAIALDENHCNRIIEALNSAGSFPKTVGLVSDIITCREDTDGSSRHAIYLAREFMMRGQYAAAADSYMSAARKSPRAAIKLRALGGASLALMLNGKPLSAVDTLVEAHLDCPNAPTILPFKEISDRLHDSDEWPNSINLGLLFSMVVQINGNDDLGKLRVSFERFCENNSVTSPADLEGRASEFGVRNVIAYLDQVWQPEIMRQTLLYATPAEIEEARIEACQALARIDPPRMRLYKEEMASRIKQQEISKATTLVEQSRVYVDIDSIKRSLRTKLKSSYAQYKSAIAHYEKPESDIISALQSAFDDVDKTTSLSTLFSKLHLIEKEELEAQSDVQFSAIFQEITKEFLVGDHGLNAYLSTRVRHGKFVDALRKSVMDEHLVTPRQVGVSYVRNAYWSTDLAGDDENLVMEALERFAYGFDETLFAVRDKNIQIQTYLDLKASDENNEGLFIYQFSKLERRLMQSYDFEFKDFDELIEKCVDSLWEKTDINLANVREYVEHDLRDEIISHFNSLTSDLASIYPEGTPSPLANAIARSRTATQQAIENVSTWFKRSEVYDRQDFDVDFPSQIAASMVNRTLSMASSWMGPKCEIEVADAMLPGRALDSLVDIFYTLFENAAKYAESESMPLNMRLQLHYQGGEFICEARSDGRIPSSERLAMLRDLKSSLDSKESSRLAQSEGRSGFRKIILALTNPIYRTPNLNFEHETDGNFVVKFSFKISE